MTGPLHMLGASHRTAPIEIREKLAVPAERTPDVYEELQRINGLHEFAVINTCNRMEVYLVSAEPEARRRIESFLCDFHGLPLETLSNHSVWRENVDAVRHLFEVASGIDSLVVGEAEILGQVKESYARAREHASLGPVLNRIFQKSFQAAKWTRTHTAIGRGQVSVGSVAVDLARKIFGDLRPCHILVLGAGEIAEKTLLNLKSRGARNIAVSNRTFARAGDLARKLEGVALPFEQIHSALNSYDIVIGSTSATTPLFRHREVETVMEQRPLRPLFLIDMAVPRDFDASLSGLENVFLYNIDDLSELAQANRTAREAEIVRCREALDVKARHLWKHLLLPHLNRNRQALG